MPQHLAVLWVLRLGQLHLRTASCTLSHTPTALYLMLQLCPVKNSGLLRNKGEDTLRMESRHALASVRPEPIKEALPMPVPGRESTGAQGNFVGRELK